ncbi:hypothetical protein [Sediminicola arcticus]|uniref:Swt1-like HEPN domain-containing protein n=1 Tax=Sediminicola arcticus TaxID=1574308 RepID=A0ABV2SQW5_9FLAO
MLETIKYATISNIYTKDLIFYEPDNTQQLVQMCENYGISYLPGKDRASCYRLIDGNFILSELTDNIICQPFDRLFDKYTISKFEKGSHDEVMFVMDEGKIKGVVHIVDYNADFINYEFFKLTFQFEKMLRQLMLLHKETDETLIAWMKQKGAKSEHWNTRYIECTPEDQEKRNELILKRRECNPFQTFFLNDLLYFSASRKYVSKEFRKSLDEIKIIRNWVAHNKDLTHKSQTNNQPLYKIDELKKFVSHANTFFNCYEELEYKIKKEL